MNEIEAKVGELVAKAATAEKAEDAVRFAQAALNAAHAAQVVAQTKTANP